MLTWLGNFDMSNHKPLWQGYTARNKMYSSDVLPLSKEQHIAQCGNESMGLLRTLHLKFCPDFESWVLWMLDKGQKSLL